jgi:hypothetical protein
MLVGSAAEVNRFIIAYGEFGRIQRNPMDQTGVAARIRQHHRRFSPAILNLASAATQ